MIRLHMLGYAMVIGIITHLNIIVIHIMMVTESDGMIMFECETMMVQKRWSMQITKERTLQSHTMNQAIEHTIITMHINFPQLHHRMDGEPVIQLYIATIQTIPRLVTTICIGTINHHISLYSFQVKVIII